jgi:uncharacterized Rossmann fold enzyme
MRSNQELRKLYKTPNLEADVKRKRLEWAGHVIRMNKTKKDKKIFGSILSCNRNRKAQSEIGGRCKE